MPSDLPQLPRRPRVIGLGEAVWDIFPDSRRAGGAPGNVAYHVQQLGAIAQLATRFGADEDGRALAAHLAGEGLDLSLVQYDPELPTGQVTVHLEDAAHPHYTIHQPAAWDRLQPEPALLKAAAEADAVCFGTLAQRSPESRETIRQVLEATSDRCLLVYDVNLRQHYYSREIIEDSLAITSIAKINHEEVAIVAPLLELPTDEREFAEAAVDEYMLDAVCITRAAEGCLVVSGDADYEIPGERVTVADTVGSGDAFTAALIVSLCLDWPLEQAARFANQVGAVVATKVGATPRVAADYSRLWDAFSPRS
ncbi:MAG: carbohydrate kinase [Planctomyces sp.]|nr:carbohydrate kinase [Planctomyces sp.]